MFVFYHDRKTEKRKESGRGRGGRREGRKEEREDSSSLEPSEGQWPCQHGDFSSLSSRTVRDFLSHAVYGHL